MNGFTELALTKLDVLSGVVGVMLCTEHVVKGKFEDILFPTQIKHLSRASNIMSTMRSWNGDLGACDTFEAFPLAAREFVRYLERAVGVPVRIVSTGPERSKIVVR